MYPGVWVYCGVMVYGCTVVYSGVWVCSGVRVFPGVYCYLARKWSCIPVTLVLVEVCSTQLGTQFSSSRYAVFLEEKHI